MQSVAVQERYNVVELHQFAKRQHVASGRSRLQQLLCVVFERFRGRLAPAATERPSSARVASVVRFLRACERLLLVDRNSVEAKQVKRCENCERLSLRTASGSAVRKRFDKRLFALLGGFES